MKIYGTEQFTYVKETKTFVTEISLLETNGFVPARFTLVSHKTDRAVEFEGYAEDRDASGEDVMGWRYRSTDPDPAMDGITVLIIND